jgi:hypothetical protein
VPSEEVVVKKFHTHIQISAPTNFSKVTGHYLGLKVKSLQDGSDEPFVTLSADRKDGKLQFDVVIGDGAKCRVNFSNLNVYKFVI